MSLRPWAIPLAFLAASATARAQDDDAAPRARKPSVSVSGTGRVSAAPDVAEIHVGVVTQAGTARDAVAANNQGMEAVRAAMKELGVAEKDVQTTQISVQPQFENIPPRPGVVAPAPRIAGYMVTNTVRITARDLSRLGRVLDAAVSTGANQVHGISFRLDRPEKLMDQARREAMADARRKAEQLAGEANVVLGPPLSIREGGGSPPPVMYGRAMMAAAPSAMPVAPGEQELTITVDVVYELRSPK